MEHEEHVIKWNN